MNEFYPLILPSLRGELEFLMKRSRRHKVGAAELIAFSKLRSYGLKQLREGYAVKIDGHWYEPDFVIIDKSKGLYIDVELDEPYSAKRFPTHYVDSSGATIDADRDARFVKAGWTVVRFSEEQLIRWPGECAALIGSLREGAAKHAVVNKLNMRRWTFDTAERMAAKQYRLSYLGFDPGRMNFADNRRCFIEGLKLLIMGIADPFLFKLLITRTFKYFK